ncbi:MAG: hypothetical protein H6735_08000 [Alphaproteobacteria bacterium]|nr:hypothetical protein [Alphaproteobacteria bacterium]
MDSTFRWEVAAGTASSIQSGMAHIDRLRNTLVWRDIPGCPGRSVLVGHSAELDETIRLHGRRFELAAARDPVWLLLTDEGRGALLSYEQLDGSFVHTLNDLAGLERKCAQLGLDLVQFRRELEQGVEVDYSWDLVVADFGADRSWAVRLVRRWSDLPLADAAQAVARPPVRLRLGLALPEAGRLLTTLRERGGDGRLVVAE